MPRTILFIEDYEDTRLAYKALLQRHGYNVLDAGTGLEARELFRTNHVDLIVSDIGLPDCLGHELISMLHSALPAGSKLTPAIALSGIGQPDDIRECLRAGFTEHVLKPAAPKLLLELIAHILAPEGEVTIEPSLLDTTVRPLQGLLKQRAPETSQNSSAMPSA